MPTMRKFFFDRFGAGQPEVLAERAKVYLLGMPEKDGDVFPPRCNMETKLDKLETEREFLLEMCPKDKRSTYDTGKECTLVRILLRTLPAEYDAAVKSVRDLTKLRKYGLLGDLTQITNKEDNTRTNYDDEWLPPYDELRVELVNSYQLQERRRKELGKSIRKHPGHPVLPILPGHDQPGPHQKRCYACGDLGHLSGDPSCTAGPNDTWKGAPSSWKARRGDDGQRKGGNKGKGKGKGGIKGKGKGKPYQRNLGDRKPTNPEGGKKTEICHNWARGNGYCKYGPSCRFLHEGPQGGKKRKADTTLLTTGGTKKARKKLVSLLVKDFKESLKGEGGRTNESVGYDIEENDNVYELIRGAPTVIITRSAKESGEYRPKWLGQTGGKENGMGYDEEPWSETGRNSPLETQFFVTLMMSKGRDDDKDYRPKRKGMEAKEDEGVASSDTSSEITSSTTKDKRKEVEVDKSSKTKNRKSKRRKNLGSVDSVDRNKNSPQMAVLSDEIRSITSLSEEAPLHGVRLPRRGVHASSLTLPREEGDE